MSRDEKTSTEKKPVSLFRGAFVGGVFGALTAVVTGQRLSDDIRSSQSLTLTSVAVGFVSGALTGFLIARSQRRAS